MHAVHITQERESEVAQSLRSRLPGSSVHGIFQARVLEWGALPSPHEGEKKNKKVTQSSNLAFQLI